MTTYEAPLGMFSTGENLYLSQVRFPQWPRPSLGKPGWLLRRPPGKTVMRRSVAGVAPTAERRTPVFLLSLHRTDCADAPNGPVLTEELEATHHVAIARAAEVIRVRSAELQLMRADRRPSSIRVFAPARKSTTAAVAALSRREQ